MPAVALLANWLSLLSVKMLAVLPATVYISPTTGGVEPFAGTGFARGFQLYLAFLVAGFAATLVAGLLGLCRIFRHANDQTRNV